MLGHDPWQGLHRDLAPRQIGLVFDRELDAAYRKQNGYPDKEIARLVHHRQELFECDGAGIGSQIGSLLPPSTYGIRHERPVKYSELIPGPLQTVVRNIRMRRVPEKPSEADRHSDEPQVDQPHLITFSFS